MIADQTEVYTVCPSGSASGTSNSVMCLILDKKEDYTLNLIQTKQWQTLFSWAPKSLLTVTAATKLKDAPWKKSCDQPRQHIIKQRHHLADKGPSSQSYDFSSNQIWM